MTVIKAVKKAYVTVGPSFADYIVDGVADDVEITAALAAADTVFIKNNPNAYALSSTLSIASGKTIIGESRQGVTLQMGSALNKSVITNANAASGITTNVRLASLTIDQQGSTQAAGGGIVVTGIQNWQLEDLTIKQSYRFNFLCLHQGNVSNLGGTITVTNGSETVTGSGTSFTTDFAIGSIIKTAGSQFGRVATIASNTSLTLTRAWGFATETGVTYKTIQPNSYNYFKNIEYQGTINDADASGYGFADYSVIEDCVSTGAAGGGCGFVPDHALGVRLINCRSYGHANSGFSYETCEDVVTIGGASWNNGANGYQLISGSTRCTAIGVDSHDNTSSGFEVSYNLTTAPFPDENTFDGCTAHNNGTYGFRVDGSNRNRATACRSYNNNIGGFLTNTSNARIPTLNSFVACSAYDDRTSKQQARGIYIATGDQTVIDMCISRDADHTTAGITDSGTNTLIMTPANGSVGIANNNPANKLTINVPNTADATAQAMIYTGANANKGLVVQATASQSGNLLEFQSSAGNPFVAMTSGGLIRGPLTSSLSTPAFSFFSDSDTGMTRPSGSANTLYLITGGSVRLQVDDSGAIDAKTQKISNVVDPTSAQDAATKAYTDTKASKGFVVAMAAAL